jgi:hypothetical protein
MHVNDISRQQFSKIASRGFRGRMTLTDQGLVLGAGTLLAKLDDKALPIEAEQERIWTLLAVAYGHGVPLAVLGSLRRVAKHWHAGDKSLAAIHLAQMGLPDVGEDAAYRLSLAAELIDAGVAPREPGSVRHKQIRRESAARAGRKRERKRPGPRGTPRRWLKAGRRVSMAELSRICPTHGCRRCHPRPDGSTIYDPDSTTKKLMAPPRANFQDIYAAGERIAIWPLLQQSCPRCIGSTESTCMRISAKSHSYHLRSIKPDRSTSPLHMAAPTLRSIEERQSAKA